MGPHSAVLSFANMTFSPFAQTPNELSAAHLVDEVASHPRAAKLISFLSHMSTLDRFNLFPAYSQGFLLFWLGLEANLLSTPANFALWSTQQKYNETTTNMIAGPTIPSQNTGSVNQSSRLGGLD
jgi:hypothetical protein